MSFDPFSSQNCPIKPLNYHLPSITLTSGESFTLRTATVKSFSENIQRRYDNERTTNSRSAASDASVSEQRTIKQLQGVLEGVLSGVELSRSAGMVDSAKVDTVACFIKQTALKAAQKKP